MDKKASPPKRKRFLIIPVLLAAVVVAILLAAGGFAFAASQESHDAFCSSCHTQPESTYYQRETASSPVDLASFHSTGQYARCIDCHSGQGLTGRLQAELLGARNAFKWYTGTAVQPAVLTFPITDANCLKCHQNVTQLGFTPKEQITVPGRGGGEGGGEGGRNNHWHEFLARWQAATPATAGTCTSCHSGHPTSGTTQTGFMDSQAVQNTCNACHQVLRREGGGGG
jgi:nitrate/TMAO reductase-like tetraheme cytochrome c subunit